MVADTWTNSISYIGTNTRSFSRPYSRANFCPHTRPNPWANSWIYSST